MTDFRFSPIKSKAKLFEAIPHLHFACHKLYDPEVDAWGYIGKKIW